MANKEVISVSKTVPIIGVKIPPFVIPSEGTFEINSHEITLDPLETISQIITNKKKQTIAVLNNKVLHSTTLDNFDDLCGMIFSKAVNKKLSQKICKKRHEEKYSCNGV